jgi:hypothetical protein
MVIGNLLTLKWESIVIQQARRTRPQLMVQTRQAHFGFFDRKQR